MLEAIISLFVIVDPLGNIPIFIQLTVGMSKSERKKTFNLAVMVGASILLGFALAGRWILEKVFHIEIWDLMMGSGILLLTLAITSLIRGLLGKEKYLESVSASDVGVVPIATPLLAGPGAIVTTIFILQKYDLLITLATVILVFVVVWLILSGVDFFYKILGVVGSKIISKVMDIFIAAIATNMIMKSLLHYFGR